MAKIVVEGTREWGLIVSIEKTKGMAVGEGLGDEDVAPVRVEGSRQIEMVEHFSYLSSVVSRDGDVTEDVKLSEGFSTGAVMRKVGFSDSSM